MRRSGILFPVFSLASRYGIGCFSQEAFGFIDFLKEAGQSCWQMLPLGPTGFGDSPYQPFSAFAGNPYFISLESLVEDALLMPMECDRVDFGANPEKIDYGLLYENRLLLLRTAYRRFKEKMLDKKSDFLDFKRKERFWLEDYALYTAIKKDQGGKSWLDWEESLKKREPKALAKAKETLAEDIGFAVFVQYEFARQWALVREYAKDREIEIIGDIPFYVAMDSADCWSHPEAFSLTKDLEPKLVAGCPPDAFSPTGQMWGNPVYDWAHQKKDGYGWWIRRIERNVELFDILRIDHFHGFDQSYAIPAGAKTAEKGIALKGPGMDLFRAMKKELGPVRIIAEDLGNKTESNETLLEESGFPGMNVLQYAFDWTESSHYLTYAHKKNSVVYTGTHDNKTARTWVEELSDHDRDFARRFIHSENTDYGGFVWDLIREAYRSGADLCIVPLQDYLVKGSEARINTPGTSGSNWQWRLKPNFLSRELAASIHELSRLYGRLPRN